MKELRAKKLTGAAVIGALYAGITLLAAPISFGTLQCRVSEALCVMPWFFPEASWGLFVGCVLANLLGGGGALDVMFGSLATLCAGLLTARIRTKWLACLPPVVLNGLVVGAVLAYATAPGAFWTAFPVLAVQVFLGEAVAMYLLGLPLLSILPKISLFRR